MENDYIRFLPLRGSDNHGIMPYLYIRDWFVRKNRSVSELFFCPGLAKTEDDQVELKITCGAFMDKSSVYFDTLDLYVDCAKTFIEGCDICLRNRRRRIIGPCFSFSRSGVVPPMCTSAGKCRS